MESNGGGGEVRRVNLVYFLSRSGHVDHPHLLRAHLLSPNGVFLRDVKKWLANARGDAMPRAFSWSCKRRYKNGYVWQDLLDDDLITPISDNEYVLKGSEIVSTSKNEEDLPKEAWSTHGDGNLQKSKLKSDLIRKESPIFRSQRSTATTSTVTEESTTNEEETSVLASVKVKPDQKKLTGENGSGHGIESGRPSVSSTTSSSSSYSKSKSYSSARASHVFRNFMKCGDLDAYDAVLVPLNKSTTWEDERKYQYQQHNARKSFEGAWNGLKVKDTMEFCRPKVTLSKPIMAPFCSQCGKLFKPEKMHSHMKLCRGIKNSSTKNDSVTGETAKPRLQRCRNLSENRQRVVRSTLKE